MPTAFFAGTHMKMIFESLPKEETEHMQRVGMLVETMVQKIRDPRILKKHRNEFWYYGEAATYHDIGKAWVSEKILLKPGKLTREEVDIIRMHPIYAKQLLDQIHSNLVTSIPKQFVKLAVDAAAYHHECWNGTGYPYGVGHEDIPLIARITCICDAYDAMTSERTYKQASTHCFACRELADNAGIQFDPDLVRIFLKNEAAFSAITQSKMLCC